MDLRERKWQKNVEAYRWFLRTTASRMSRRACANYDPGQFELRDYFVEFRIPMIWISHPKDCRRSPPRPGQTKNRLPATCFRGFRPIFRVSVGGTPGKAARKAAARMVPIRAWTLPASTEVRDLYRL